MRNGLDPYWESFGLRGEAERFSALVSDTAFGTGPLTALQPLSIPPAPPPIELVSPIDTFQAPDLHTADIVGACLCESHGPHHDFDKLNLGPLGALPLPSVNTLAYSASVTLDENGFASEFFITVNAGQYFIDIPSVIEGDDTTDLWLSIEDGDGNFLLYRNLNGSEAVPLEALEDGTTFRFVIDRGAANAEIDLNLHSFDIEPGLYRYLLAGNAFNLARHHARTGEEAISTVLFYSFNEDPARGSYFYGATPDDVTEIGTQNRDNFRAIMDRLSQEIGIQFVEIDEAATGITPDLRITAVMNTDAITAGGYAGVGDSGAQATDITLVYYDNTDPRWPEYVFAHELGHALGLKHPFSPGGPFGPLNDSALEPIYENQFFSVMSYTWTTGYQTYFREMDLDALRFLYGTADGLPELSFDAAMQVATLTGTSGDDRFSGTDFADVATLGDGDDWFEGAFGDDHVMGGAGHDIISAYDGDNTLEGGAGNDSLTGGGGFDILRGGDGDDILDGGWGADEMYGGAGQDTIRVTWGDAAEGGAGDDTFIYNYSLGDGRIDGGEGFDVYTAATSEGSAYIYLHQADITSIELFIGSDYRDYFYNDDASSVDRFHGGDGDDIFYSVDGNDQVMGGAGRDIVYLVGFTDGVTLDFTDLSSASANIMDVFEDGIEVLHLTGFADIVTGGDEDNLFYGNGGDDQLFGGGGNDILLSGWGNDIMTGGTGRDVFGVDNYNRDVVTDFTPGEDQLQMAGDSYMSWDDMLGLLTQRDGYVEVALSGGGVAELHGVLIGELSLSDFRIEGADGFGPFRDPGKPDNSPKDDGSGASGEADSANPVAADDPDMVDLFG